MQSTKGQLTAFIVIGLVILAGAFLIFTFYGKSAQETLEESLVDLQTASIQSFVQSCMEKTAKKAILKNGRTGGYFILPEQHTEGSYGELPYYHELPYYQDGDQILIPSDKLLADHIAMHVDAVLDLCFDDFKEFKEQGYQITFEKPETTASLTPTTLTLTSAMPLTIKRKTESQTINKFTATMPVSDWYESILTARAVVESHKNGEVCLTCFADRAEKSVIFVGIIPISETETIFDLEDRNYFIDQEPFHFRFAVRFGKGEE